MKPPKFNLQPNAAEVYSDLQPAYRETLVAPLDDMWAAFADMASPYALLVNSEVAGFCSVSEEQELLSFHVRARFEDVAEALFSFLIQRLELVAALPSTVDPSFLTLSLEAGGEAVPRALMYHHVLEPEGSALTGLRLATAEDHGAAVAFAEAAIEAPRSFLESYLGERIEKGEVLFYEPRGEILASGECRHDPRWPGYAHVGMIVGSGQRGRGLGSGLIHALVLESRRRKLEPLCSTEPQNLPARRAIYKAGFRARHRVLRVVLHPGS